MSNHQPFGKELVPVDSSDSQRASEYNALNEQFVDSSSPESTPHQKIIRPASAINVQGDLV